MIYLTLHLNIHDVDWYYCVDVRLVLILSQYLLHEDCYGQQNGYILWSRCVASHIYHIPNTHAVNNILIEQICALRTNLLLKNTTTIFLKHGCVYVCLSVCFVRCIMSVKMHSLDISQNVWSLTPDLCQCQIFLSIWEAWMGGRGGITPTCITIMLHLCIWNIFFI